MSDVTIQRVRVQQGKVSTTEEPAQEAVVALASPTGLTLVRGLLVLAH